MGIVKVHYLQEAGLLQGFTWMNYCLVIFIAVPLGCLLVVRVQYRRSDRDREQREAEQRI